MRVAILGSWPRKPRWRLRGSQEEFSSACRRIGRELVQRGHSLIVGSDGEHTADRHAVLGALEESPETSTEAPPRVCLVRAAASDDTRPFAAERRDWPGLIVESPSEAGSQAVVKLMQTQMADAVILVGGAEHTEQAGVATAIFRKPLACVGSFGGAAKLLNDRFAAHPAAWGIDPARAGRLRQLQEDFGDRVLRYAFDAASISDAPKLFLIHGHSTDRDELKRELEAQGRAGRVVVLADEFRPTMAIPDKFEQEAQLVDGAIALITPDDYWGPSGENQAVHRARQNVWIEVGWFWGRRGRRKVLMLTKGQVEIPSDLGNVEHYPYNESPMERLSEIERFLVLLRSAGDAPGAS